MLTLMYFLMFLPALGIVGRPDRQLSFVFRTNEAVPASMALIPQRLYTCARFTARRPATITWILDVYLSKRLSEESKSFVGTAAPVLKCAVRSRSTAIPTRTRTH